VSVLCLLTLRYFDLLLPLLLMGFVVVVTACRVAHAILAASRMSNLVEEAEEQSDEACRSVGRCDDVPG